MTLILRLLLAMVLMHTAVATAHAQRAINERRAVVPNGFIRIFTQQGQVNVAGWDKDSIHVTGTVVDPPGERFSIGVTRQGAKLGVWSEEEPGAKPSNITIYLPKRSQVWVKTSGANITVLNVEGGLDLFSVTGHITVSGAPRQVYAETMAGGINLHDAHTASARLKTASGTIRMNGEVSDLTAVTVSGDISSSLTTFARARLESVDGHIRYYGAIPNSSVIDLINHAGAVTMIIPAQTSANFAFNLYEADLVDDFGIRKRWVSSKLKAKEMSFGLGDRPTARVMIRSFKGPVALRRLDAAK